MSGPKRVHVAPAGFGDGERLAGGGVRFDSLRLTLDNTERRIALDDLSAGVADLPEDIRARIVLLRDALVTPRSPIAGLVFDRPHVMGIVNVTPDSFSDGGAGGDPVAAALAMAAAGASIVDLGGESTRPRAAVVDTQEELARVGPVLAGLRNSGITVSIDTRKALVMAAALDAGATLVNDVSALTYDPAAIALVAARGAPVVLMHSQGTPATMQDSPVYADPLRDVFDWLEARIATCVAAGIKRERIIADPGIGFGKTLEHNLALLRGVALFHGLGVPITLGASRKAIIGTLAGGAPVGERLGGSVALALHAVANGVQIVRVHDVAATVQAIKLWQAVH
nr:dihydropteroate synthase [Polymorphobacter megasporae]